MLQLHEKSGKKHPLWLVDSEYKLGSDAQCEIQIQEPGINSLHARLDVDGDNVVFTDLSQSLEITVNGEPVTQPQPLVHGDVLEIGAFAFDVLDPKKRKVTPVAKQPVVHKDSDHWRLKPLNTALQGQTFIIDREVVIGRSKECDFTLVVAHLSRKHARLSISGDHLHVRDLDSANGTFVNKHKVTEHMLNHGDELSFDTLKFAVLAPDNIAQLDKNEPDEDLDKTTMRPVISAQVINKASSDHISDKKSEIPEPVSKRSQKELEPESITPSSPQNYDDHDKSGVTTKILIALIVLGVAAATWFIVN